MTEYEDQFNKKYTFNNKERYVLPNTIFESSKWFLTELQKMKKQLNKVKSLLNKYKLKVWSQHTANRDPAGLVMAKLSETVQPELLTQAWCKFYEILCQFPVISLDISGTKKFTSLHLCEAPGAFVCALNHYVTLNYPDLEWAWMANTLNPNYEGNESSQMISDDRFIRCTEKNWNFGSDFSGDITKFHNHTFLVKDPLFTKKILLATADGSVDCRNDPGEQERHVEYLHFCETMTALAILQEGGTFILKVFTMFEDTTINLLYLLNCLFGKVTVFKPCTSKSGNSEVYVVNTNFRGFHYLKDVWSKMTSVYSDAEEFSLKSMFYLEEIPNHFLEDIHKCADFFMQQQMKTILDNIYHFEHKRRTSSDIYIKRLFVAQLYFQLYDPKCIPDEKKLVPNVNIVENWRVPPSHKFSFYRAHLKNLVKGSDINYAMLQIKFGKRIDTVRNSKFTNKYNLQKLISFFCGKNKQDSLYQQVVDSLSYNNVVINVRTFHLHQYYSFQGSFFQNVYDSLNEGKNIIFVNIPFITHFLVGILYILVHAFKNVYFGSGIIVLVKPDCSLIQEIRKLFSVVKSNLDLLDEHNVNVTDSKNSFFSDIVQLVSPNRFEETSLAGLIWNYNNKLFDQNKIALKPFNYSKLNT